MNRKTVSIGLAVACTAGFLWLAVRNVRFGELWPILSQARLVWFLAMAVGICIVDIGFRALRWKILLSQAVSAPALTLFQLENIGLAVNNMLFARLGELLRAVLAARRLGVPLATTLASVVVERALDVAALLVIFVSAAAFHPELVSAPVRRTGMVILAGVVAGLVFLVLAERTLEPDGMLEKRLRSWPKAHEVMGHMALGAAVLRRPKALLPVLGLSLVLWLFDASIYWFGAKSLGLDVFIDYPRAILVLSWAGAGAALPAVPGALGTFEAMVTSVVTKMGASPDAAFAYALFVHMTMYLLVTTMGLIMLYRMGLSLGGIQDSVKTDPSKEAGKK